MNHHTDGNDSPRGAREIAWEAAESIRTLNHLTQPSAGENLAPADIDQVVAALSQAADRLPQLLRQIGDLLHHRQHAGLLRVDRTSPLPDPAQVVTDATSALRQAAGHAARAGRVLDAAHQTLAHLAASTGTGQDFDRRPRDPDRAVAGLPGGRALASIRGRNPADRRHDGSRSR